MQEVTIHPTSDVQSVHIGEGTQIWQFCVILNSARIGKNCNINSNVFIENDVYIGNTVTVKCGVQLWDGMRIGDKVFIGPNATFTNDLIPRTGVHPEKFLETHIMEGASIGANSTVLGNRIIGKYAMIGAGSVVTCDIPDHTLWYGNPAKFRGYVCRCGSKLGDDMVCPQCKEKISIENIRDNLFRDIKYGTISSKADIHNNVKIGRGVTISENAVVYSNVEIGDGTFVGRGCVLGEPLASYYNDPNKYENPSLVIGENSIIRSGTVIYAGSILGREMNTGHNAIIREGTKIGINCTVGSFTDIQGFVEIGDYCRFHSNVHIGQYSHIKNFVFMFPNTILTNDPHPPSDTCIKGPTVEDYAVISSGAILMPGITVGRDSVVGANSLVTKDVEPEKVVLGMPARPICTIHDIKCQENRLEKTYPWREHFSRGMPWEKLDEAKNDSFLRSEKN
jgi:acetyltransferase-like isoleucine patch superfamily enzyme